MDAKKKSKVNADGWIENVWGPRSQWTTTAGTSRASFSKGGKCFIK